MAFDITKIHVGAARIFVGVTNAASGTPPTYVTHTNGVPSTGTEVGLTNGDCTFIYTQKKSEVMVEQSLAPVDLWVDTENAQLDFTCSEANATALKKAFDDSVGYDSTGGDGFYFGNGTAVLAPTVTGIFFSAPRRDNPAKYFTGQLYKAYTKDGLKFPFSRTKRGDFKVVLIGLADLTRTAKDQVGYFRREL